MEILKTKEQVGHFLYNERFYVVCTEEASHVRGLFLFKRITVKRKWALKSNLKYM